MPEFFASGAPSTAPVRCAGVSRDDGRWNHNIEYQRVILEAVPAGARRALDVGCGEGILARALRTRAAHVTGIDAHPPSLALARAEGADGIDYVCGDFLTHPLEPASFDFIGCVAALHHMDAEAALTRMTELLRPGGSLGIVGLASRRWPHDLPLDAMASVLTRLHRLTKPEWTTPAPTVWPPPHTFGEAKRMARRLLPGARYRRHVLWRYTLTWTKP